VAPKNAPPPLGRFFWAFPCTDRLIGAPSLALASQRKVPLFTWLLRKTGATSEPGRVEPAGDVQLPVLAGQSDR